MSQIRISAKSLAELALPSFCTRCFWIKRHARSLPFQAFPGIFNSIDAYSKKINRAHFAIHNQVLSWFIQNGYEGAPQIVPHYTRFQVQDAASDILLTGVPDEIFHLTDGTYAIIDYKTARFTGAQDAFFPLYEAQLNAYAHIGNQVGFDPVTRLLLVYYEPLTEIGDETVDNFLIEKGFAMHFNAYLLPVQLDPHLVPGLLARARSIHDLPYPPKGNESCKDCQALDSLLSLLGG